MTISDLALMRKWRQPGPLDVCFAPLEDPTDASIADAERIFFAGLQLSNGTFKTTAPHRLDEVNELVFPLLPKRRPLRIMDVAVSSGATTAEWSEQLTAKKIDHDLIATDLAVDGDLLTVGRRIAILWEPDARLLAIQIGQRTLYLQQSGRKRIIKAGLSALLRAVYLAASRRATAPAGTPPSPWAIRLRPVPLVTRGLVRNPSIRIVPDDITESGHFVGQVDVCRAANILNRVYFPDHVIQTIVQNLLARVQTQGILVVCRTRDDEGSGENQATVFRVEGRSVTVAARLNGGSEVEAIVVSLSGHSHNGDAADGEGG